MFESHFRFMFLGMPALFICVLLTSCSGAAKKNHEFNLLSGPTEKASTFTIIATTDFHVSFDRAEPFALNVRELQQKYRDQQVTVSAGDLFQGSMEGNLFKGKAAIDFINLLNFDAMALGNHDFDYGPLREGSVIPRAGEDPRGSLKARVKESHFPWISANVLLKRTHQTFLPSHAEKTLRIGGKDFKVCMIGGTTTDTPRIVFPDAVRDLEFLPLASVVAKKAQILRKENGCSFVMLVAHAGLSCKEAFPAGDPGDCLVKDSHSEILDMLEQMPEHTLDAVVAGHTHLRAAEVIRGTPVIQAGAFASEVATLHFQVGPELKFLGYAHHEIPKQPSLSTAEAEKVSDITQALAPYRQKTARLKNKVLGCLTQEFPHQRKEQSALANATAEAYLEAAPQADVGIQNGGGVRRSLPQGNVTYGDIFNALPFDNEFTVVKDMPGHLLRTLLEICVTGSHYVCAFQGARVYVDRTAFENGVQHLTRDLNGDGKKELWEQNFTRSIEIWSSQNHRFEPLDDRKNYTIATQSYLTRGGDDQGFVYNQIEKTKIKTYYDLNMREVFARYFVNHSKNSNTPGGCFDPTPFLDESASVPARKRSLLWSTPASQPN